MTNIVKELTPAILQIAGVLLSAFATWLGLQAKKWLDTKQKREIAETSVKYVEQVGKALGSTEKLALAKETMIAMLAKVGITITDTEMTALIEAACSAFTTHYKK